MYNKSEKTEEGKKGKIYKKEIFDKFVVWFSLDALGKKNSGARSQREFANINGVNEDTLSIWKKQEDFKNRVDGLRKDWGRAQTPNVLTGLLKGSVKGDPRAIELWLAYFEGWDKKQVIENKIQEFSQNDLLAVISVLPEEEQKRVMNIITTSIIRARKIKQDDKIIDTTLSSETP